VNNYFIKESPNGIVIGFINGGTSGGKTSVVTSLKDKVNKIGGKSGMLQDLTDCGYIPIRRQGVNYLNYCQKNEDQNSIQTVLSNSQPIFWKYTSESGWYCTKINLFLACDSDSLKEELHSKYVRDLKICVDYKKMKVSQICFRGADFSPLEILTMQAKKMFFIPSFVSTSTDTKKIFFKKKIPKFTLT